MTEVWVSQASVVSSDSVRGLKYNFYEMGNNDLASCGAYDVVWRWKSPFLCGHKFSNAVIFETKPTLVLKILSRLLQNRIWTMRSLVKHATFELLMLADFYELFIPLVPRKTMAWKESYIGVVWKDRVTNSNFEPLSGEPKIQLVVRSLTLLRSRLVGRLDLLLGVYDNKWTQDTKQQQKCRMHSTAGIQQYLFVVLKTTWKYARRISLTTLDAMVEDNMTTSRYITQAATYSSIRSVTSNISGALF